MLAVFGYLLLVLLQPYAAWRTFTSANQNQRSKLMAAIGRLAEIRQEILSAATAPDLQGRLQALQGPALSPADPPFARSSRA